MAVSRFSMASNKKSALMKQNMREISQLLTNGKEESARIKAEALIRDDGTIEAYEILQLSCDLLFERIKLISSSSTCPEDLKSTIATLIWASNRVDVKELEEIRKQFRFKFGKQFDADAFENKNSMCNERIVAKLSVQPPTAYLVQTYLEKIADEFNVDWKPAHRLKPDQMAEPMAAPIGYSVKVAPGSGLVAYPAPMPTPMPPPSTAPGTTAGGGGGDEASIAISSVAVSNNVNDDAVSEMGDAEVSSVASPAPSSRGGHVDKKDPYDNIPVAQVVQPEDDIYIPPAPGAVDSKPSADDDFDDLQARFNNLKK
jgi:hypothetical protein